METDAPTPPPDWSRLVGLQQRCLDAGDETELAFLIANDAWHLAPYAQACVFLRDATGRPRLRVVSGLADANESTPFTQWVHRVCRALIEAPAATGHRPFDASALDPSLREGWQEWWPQYALYVPLVGARGQVHGATLFVRDTPWTDADLAQLRLLLNTCARVFEALRPSRLRGSWQPWRRRPWLRWAAALAVLVALCFPVRLSVLAPAEIIALRSEAVAAPAEGVVKSFAVQPNQPVRRGQLLFSLDDTTLRNRREIAERALAVARADVLAAEQKAFDNPQSRAEVAVLRGRVREKDAELAYVDALLLRIEVRAEHDGVLVYGDPNDWLGKPVVTGERIAQLAQPEPLGVLVWLPVADAITLEVGAPMRVYLQVSPLDALSGELVQTSYQASLSDEGVAAYRIRGRLQDGQRAHIGLRGVAKIHAGWQPLAYWLFRRPLGALRQWVGL